MAKINAWHASYFKADADLKEIHLVEKSKKGFKTLNGALNEARKVDGEAITVKRDDVEDLLHLPTIPELKVTLNDAQTAYAAAVAAQGALGDGASASDKGKATTAVNTAKKALDDAQKAYDKATK